MWEILQHKNVVPNKGEMQGWGASIKKERCRDVCSKQERRAGMGCIKQERDMQGRGASNKRVMQG